MSESFYRFFAPKTISTRDDAVKAVVAGAIGGGLLTLVTACEFAMQTAWFGIRSISAVFFLVTLILTILATVGTWKRAVSAAAAGIVLGLATIVWLGLRGESVLALVFALPIVGGFWTAFRGIRALNDPASASSA